MSTTQTTIRILAIASLAALAALVGGCDLFDDAPPSPPPGQTPATPAPDAQKAPGETTQQQTPEEEYRRPDLPIGSRRDPFVFEPPKAEVEEENIERQLEPLESFDINQLKLVAILTGTVVPKAMFVDPTNFGHIAKEEDRIGRNGGRITDIRDNEVEVVVNPRTGTNAGEQGSEEAPAEPVTLVIRLSDTELPPVEEGADEEGAEEILDALEGAKDEQRSEGGGRAAPRPLP